MKANKFLYSLLILVIVVSTCGSKPFLAKADLVSASEYSYEEQLGLKELDILREMYRIEPEPQPIEAEEIPEEVEIETYDYYISDDDIALIALITMAEAEGESELGQRLVIDTILNRLNSPSYANTVEGVIYQPGAFSCLYDGRVDRCYVMEEMVELVKEELTVQVNYDCIYFCGGGYSAYGTPMFQEGGHYFSSR